ncbi:NAD(P)-dependent alcohol dehydrogenase [Methanococcoides methylutens]|uniref:Bifunctional protein: zinc-containing alcohol dehydrogenase n=1 Tax=Methanococcoides methylutens MM1 TaxID=1434104 RepID=A0A0E3SR18_METMT|nr:NAD(P)-dependent alcohol dehydrogenase [Methanococcoides methylutens]AKB85236.1 Bifunctional protein: zinc-containing alcohol dehydrogenase [Methanococcoides methylutens MM1]
MKAFVYYKYGSFDVLQLTEVDKPIPKDSEVLIKIHATTVTIGDTIMRSFKLPTPRWQWIPARLYLGIRGPKRPVLGMELAGEIEAVGTDVTRFSVGDQVFASTFRENFGGHAEYKCMPEDGLLILKPENLTYEEAAAVPGGGMTALQLLKKGNVRSGQKVLINGASGAVGTNAVQLAKHFGAEVTGVCSTSNMDLVKSLGADKVIDYTKEDFTKSEETYDMVLDAVGKIPSSKAKSVLKKGGNYLNVLASADDGDTIENLTFLKELIESGDLKPVIDRIYPFEQIPEAHKYVEQGHKKGNVAIAVDHGNNAD